MWNILPYSPEGQDLVEGYLPHCGGPFNVFNPVDSAKHTFSSYTIVVEAGFERVPERRSVDVIDKTAATDEGPWSGIVCEPGRCELGRGLNACRCRRDAAWVRWRGDGSRRVGR